MRRVLLVSNHLLDGQESMLRFCRMLERELPALGCEVRVTRPSAIFNRLYPKFEGAGKWLGYIDKYLLYPARLKREAAWADLVHVCDHSNSVYLQFLDDKASVVTCHDLGAVRAALNEDTTCPISPFGRILQKWIMSGLRKARLVVCDSSYTKGDVERLLPEINPDRLETVLVALDNQFSVISPEESASRLAGISNLDATTPFVLHVGSSQPRKNRDGIMRIFARVKDRLPGQLVFAGSALTPDLVAESERLGIADRMLQVVKPDDRVLEALYNRALVLLFPSYFEGFGWPIIEAQAGGCPVICSDRCSIPEVAGDSTLMRPVEDEEGFAQDLLRVLDAQQRCELVAKGFENVQRFSVASMARRYRDLYETLLVDKSLSAGKV